MTFGSHKKWQLSAYANHRAELKRRGLTVEHAEKRGYERLTAKETWQEIHQQVGETIALPVLRADGKPHPERRYCVIDAAVREATGKKKRKYTERFGAGILIHIRRPQKPNKSLRRTYYITEGEFKADAIAEATGATAVCVPGTGCFLKKGQIHPDIVALGLGKGDTVKFAYDTDQMVNLGGVMKPLFDFAGRIVELGAKVKFVDLPAVANIEKTGADDVVQHLGAEALLKATEHDYDSPWAEKWRKRIAESSGETQLPASLLDLHPFDAAWYRDRPPEPEFIVAPLWQAGESAQLVGQAGVGKTYFSLNMLAAIGAGVEFFGYPVPQARRALYLMCERHESSLRRRWYKVAHAMASDQADRKKFERLLHENCYLKAIAGESLNLIEFVHNQWRPSSAVDALIAELISAGITVLFLDPLSRLHGGNENDSAVGAAITKALERIAQLAGCSVLFVHHTGKNGRDDMYAGRGSSTFNDNTSETIVLTKIEPTERQGLDFSDLRPNELFYDVVKMRHARCSDGRPAPDTYLVRDGATGLLRRISVERKSADAVLSEGIDSVRRWLSGLDDDAFSLNQFVKGRAEFSSWSRNRATEVFNNAINSGLFVQATTEQGGTVVPKLRKGSRLYRISPEFGGASVEFPRSPGKIRESGNDPKAGRF